MERDADGRLTMTKTRQIPVDGDGKELTLATAERDYHVRTAALDVRQAAKLGETRVPKPKVWPEERGIFGYHKNVVLRRYGLWAKAKS